MKIMHVIHQSKMHVIHHIIDIPSKKERCQPKIPCKHLTICICSYHNKINRMRVQHTENMDTKIVTKSAVCVIHSDVFCQRRDLIVHLSVNWLKSIGSTLSKVVSRVGKEMLVDVHHLRNRTQPGILSFHQSSALGGSVTRNFDFGISSDYRIWLRTFIALYFSNGGDYLHAFDKRTVLLRIVNLHKLSAQWEHIKLDISDEHFLYRFMRWLLTFIFTS